MSQSSIDTREIIASNEGLQSDGDGKVSKKVGKRSTD